MRLLPRLIRSPSFTRQGARRGAFLSLAVFTALAADLLLAITVIDGLLSPALAVLAHGLMAVGIGVLVFLWLAESLTAWVLALWIALLGPLGALVAGAALLISMRPKSVLLEDEQWYQRLRGFEEAGDELVTALRDDRAYRGDGVDLHSFRQIMASGTVSQKQTILGLIAQSYEPALFGFLMDALRSPEVAVRASAAAVFARLRDRQVADLKLAEDLARSNDPRDLLQAATKFAEAAASRLMSERDSADAHRRALVLRRKISRSEVVPLTVKAFDRQLKGRGLARGGGSLVAPNSSGSEGLQSSPARRTEGLP